MHDFAPISETHAVSSVTTQRVSIRAISGDKLSINSLLRDGIVIAPHEIETVSIVETTTTHARRIK